MRRRIGFWAFIAGGVAVALWGVSAWFWPATVCRGVEMHPGDVCSYSSYTETGTSKTQSYEERVAAARQSAPVGVVVGLAAAAFGVYVARRPQGSSDIGP